MFCNDKGIERKTYAPRTPPQNGISIQEIYMRDMLASNTNLFKNKSIN